jgi:hypothetical protein
MVEKNLYSADQGVNYPACSNPEGLGLHMALQQVALHAFDHGPHEFVMDASGN